MASSDDGTGETTGSHKFDWYVILWWFYKMFKMFNICFDICLIVGLFNDQLTGQLSSVYHNYLVINVS